MGTLYVVATPIGNLEDMSFRAVRVLSSVALIAAEDTRVARRLLGQKPEAGARLPRLLSYNEHNRQQRIPEVIAALEEGDVALVSDAGTPAISDPGVELVAAARAAGFRVEAVPGPSAVVTALSVAGLNARQWTFLGFLPRQAGELRKLLAQHNRAIDPSGKGDGETLVAYEAPSRLRKTLGVIAEVLPERRIAVCRELTKVHEEVFVGTAAEALAHFSEVRGEIVLVIECPDAKGQSGAGGEKGRKGANESTEAGVRVEVALMSSLGLTQSQAAALLQARYGVSRRRAYALWLEAARL